MKIKTFVKKNGEFWITRFTIGVQTFTIENGGERTKKEALWYKKNLDTAFENAKLQELEKSENQPTDEYTKGYKQGWHDCCEDAKLYPSSS